MNDKNKIHIDWNLEINSKYAYGLLLVLNGVRTSLIKMINVKY